MLPARNARMRKRPRRNIGASTFVSTTPNATSSATPVDSSVSTFGLVQPIAEVP